MRGIINDQLFLQLQMIQLLVMMRGVRNDQLERIIPGHENELQLLLTDP